jgi:hypothetical protein
LQALFRDDPVLFLRFLKRPVEVVELDLAEIPPMIVEDLPQQRGVS